MQLINNYFSRYTYRKITIFSFLFFSIFAIIMLNNLNNVYLDYQNREAAFFKSSALQMAKDQRPLFWSIIITLYIIMSIIIMLSIVMTINFIRETNNNKVFLRIVTWLFVVVFILIFLIISIAPTGGMKTDGETSSGQPLFKFLIKPNYISGYLILVGSIIMFFMGLTSRYTFGYLTNDKTLKKYNERIKHVKKN